MTNEKFMEFAKEKCDTVLQTLEKKGAEYSRSKDDRFLNFKIAAAIQGVSTQEAILGQLSKHLASIVDMIHSPIDPEQLDIWAEKTGDAIAYLIHLEGTVREAAEEIRKQQELEKLLGDIITFNKPDPTSQKLFDGNIVHGKRKY